MAGLGYVAALVLAATFAAAAVAKARTPHATSATFRALGLPAAGALARVVPVLEAATAVTLVAVPRAGAIASLLLLAAFTAVLARAVSAGVDVDCGCFGSSTRTPVSSVALVRNALLLVAAGVATAAEPAVPPLAAAVTGTVGATLGAVVVGLAEVRRATGALWHVEVPS